MALWSEIKDIFRGEVSLQELTDPTRAGARLRDYALLARETLRSIRRDDTFGRASALAFKTLLAIVPVLAISLAIIAMFDPGKGRLEGGAAISYEDSFLQVIRDRIPEFGGRDELIESVRRIAANAVAIAGVGLLFLFGTAFTLLNSIESAFNAIWQVRNRRTFLGRLSAFLATLLIVPVLMSLSVYLTTGLSDLLDRGARLLPAAILGSQKPEGETPAVANQEEAEPDDAVVSVGSEDRTAAIDAALRIPPSAIKRFVLRLASLGMSIIAMSVLFYLIPYTPVRVRAALAGGIFAGVLFELAMFLFRYYASNVATNYTKVYGPLLAVPLFLLWVWLVWVIVLLGAEIAFSIQNFRDLAARAELEKRGIASRIYLGVRIVLSASVYFHRGESPEGMVDRVAEELQVPPYMVREIILLLVEKNVLRRVEPAGEDSYLPAKDIAALTVAEVMSAIASDPLDIPEMPQDQMRQYLAKLFCRLEIASADILGGVSFADLVNLEERGRLDRQTTMLVV